MRVREEREGEYSLEVEQLFMFLQRAIYEFETLWDRQTCSQFTSSVLATIQENINHFLNYSYRKYTLHHAYLLFVQRKCKFCKPFVNTF